MKVDYQRISVMAQEKSEVKAEVLEYQKAQMILITSSLALVATVVSVLITKYDFGSHPSLQIRQYVAFAGSQVGFALGIYGLFLLHLVDLHQAYVKAIEAKMNSLIGEPTVIWISEITRVFCDEPWRAFTVILYVLLLLLLCGLGYLVYISYELFHWPVLVVASAELASVCTLLNYSHKETHKAYLHALDKFGLGERGDNLRV